MNRNGINTLVNRQRLLNEIFKNKMQVYATYADTLNSKTQIG